MPVLPALRFVDLDRCTNLAQITGLRANNSLEKLTLGNNDALKGLEGLADQTQLRSLKINEAGEIVDLSGLDGLECLEELQIFNCRKLVSFGGAVSLPNLKLLHVHNCNRLMDLSGMSAPNLVDLTIHCFDGYGSSQSDFSDLEKLPQSKKLDRLSLHGLKAVRSLEPLAERKIKNLNISNRSLGAVQSLDLTPVKDVEKLRIVVHGLTRIEGWEAMTQLRELSLLSDRLQINSLPSLEKLEALRLNQDTRLPHLRRLHINSRGIQSLDCLNQIEDLTLTCDKELLTSISGLDKLTKLRLNIYDSSAPSLDLGFLSRATNLRVLSISTRQTLDDMNFLKDLKQLEKLRVAWRHEELLSLPPPAPSDIGAIESCQQLQVLSLTQNMHRELPGLEAIAGLKQMRELRLDRFRFKDLELLRKMQDLEVLRLGHMSKIRSIRGIENKTKLRSLKIRNLSEVADHARILKTLPAYDAEDDSAYEDHSAIAGAKTREQGTSSELKFASKTALTGNLTEEFRFLFG